MLGIRNILGHRQNNRGAFLRQRLDVVACSRNPETNPFPPSDSRLISPPMNVTNDESVFKEYGDSGTVRLYQHPRQQCRYGLFGPLEGANRGQLEAQFSTNVFGTARVIRHVLPGSSRAQRSGMIVNVSSIGGRMAAFPARLVITRPNRPASCCIKNCAGYPPVR